MEKTKRLENGKVGKLHLKQLGGGNFISRLVASALS